MHDHGRTSGRGAAQPTAVLRATRRATVTGALALAVLATAPAGRAVLIASGDGTGNTTAPLDDPGFALVGILNGLSAVWMGNGWVLTAHHVGQGNVTFGGTVYPFVPGSFARLTGPGTGPDLALMKIVGGPALPAPTLASSTPPGNVDVVLIGNGKDRGAPLTWNAIDGWNWLYPFTIRWGTNRVSQTGVVWSDTQAIEMTFGPSSGPSSTTHEAQATLGDSGGAVFWKSGGQWRLAGTLFIALGFNGQPDKTSLFGNVSVAADLSAYRSQILARVGTPACSDGLDDDLDGAADHPADPGCDSASDTSERSAALPCDDGEDNDGDGLVDHPADPQCSSPSTPSEAPPVPIGALWSSGALAGSLLGAGTRALRVGSPGRKGS